MLSRSHLITLKHLRPSSYIQASFLNSLIDISVKYELNKALCNNAFEHLNVSYNYTKYFNTNNPDDYIGTYRLPVEQESELRYINNVIYNFIEQILEEYNIQTKFIDNSVTVLNISSNLLNSSTLVISAEVFLDAK